MDEIVDFELDTFWIDAQRAEELMVLRSQQEKEKRLEKKIDKRIITKNDRRLLAKLMIWAAYNQDDYRIHKYVNFIYRKLFGRKWNHNQVWTDQPINCLDIDLIDMVNGKGLCEEEEPYTYDELVQHAYRLIDEICNDRDSINEMCGLYY